MGRASAETQRVGGQGPGPGHGIGHRPLHHLDQVGPVAGDRLQLGRRHALGQLVEERHQAAGDLGGPLSVDADLGEGQIDQPLPRRDRSDQPDGTPVVDVHPGGVRPPGDVPEEIADPVDDLNRRGGVVDGRRQGPDGDSKTQCQVCSTIFYRR